MVRIINAKNRSLSETEVLARRRQRTAVLVDEEGWNVPVIGDMEVDGCDGADTTCLIARPDCDSRQALGAARLPRDWPRRRRIDDEITAAVMSIAPLGLRATRGRLGIDGPVSGMPLPAVKVAA